MATVNLTLSMRPKWWLRPAILGGMIALRFGLIKRKRDPERISGWIEPDERLAKWLADIAFTLEIR